MSGSTLTRFSRRQTVSHTQYRCTQVSSSHHSVDWIASGALRHLVLVILAKSDGKTLERWTFEINHHSKALRIAPNRRGDEPPQDISVPNVLKQVVAATTFLPELPSPSVFNILTYVSDEGSSNIEESSWRDLTDIGWCPFGDDVETQQVSLSSGRYVVAKDSPLQKTLLRGVKTATCDVDLQLTALEDI